MYCLLSGSLFETDLEILKLVKIFIKITKELTE